MFVNKKTKGRAESVFHFLYGNAANTKKIPQSQTTDCHKKKGGRGERSKL